LTCAKFVFCIHGHIVLSENIKVDIESPMEMTHKATPSFFIQSLSGPKSP
jgi:hypothetical protein